MLGPFATTSRLTPIHQMSLAVLSRAACASMFTTTTTTTTTTRDRGDHGMGPKTNAVLHRRSFIAILPGSSRIANIRKILAYVSNPT